MAVGTLYLVPVPIGNTDDITLRALDVLRSVDLVAAEDTRDYRELARAHGMSTRAISYHDWNEAARSGELIERLSAGESVAVVSDAGTPLLSDPGYRIVAAAVEAGVPVVSLPGASAVTTALAACGLPTVPFLFAGFPPRTAAKRRAFYAELASTNATMVLFEAPHRLLASMRDACAALGDRPACLARNLTKPHERWQRGRLTRLIGDLEREEADEGAVRGEATVVIAGVGEEPAANRAEEADRMAAALLESGTEARDVVERLIRDHGMRKRAAYALVVRLREER